MDDSEKNGNGGFRNARFNPEALHKALNEVKAGRIGYVWSTDFYLKYTETKPIDGYQQYIEEHQKDKQFPP